MPLTLEELVELRNIVVFAKNISMTSEMINSLLNSQRVLEREIRLKTLNPITGEYNTTITELKNVIKDICSRG
jgi:hypothetical protein